ncbi:MAG: HlyD family efflux transporter periplasmic adaptor subunit [Motiliproteus sp.]
MTAAPSFSRKLLPFFLVFIVLGAAAGIFYLLISTKPQAADKVITEKTWTVASTAARPQAIAPSLTLYGRLESPRSSAITAAVTAFVQERKVDEGTRIHKGDILLVLDPRDVRLNLAQREADLSDIDARINAEITRYQSDLKALVIERKLLSLAQRSVERFKELKGRKVGTDTQLDDARRSYQQQALNINNRQLNINDHENRRAQLQAQKNQLQALRDSTLLDLERTLITAPFDGRISYVSVAPGDRVRSGDPLLRMYNTESMEVRAQIPSRYLQSIRKSLEQKHELKALGELDGESIKLRLQRLSSEVVDGRAGVDALLQVTSDSNNLELGRALEIQLQLPEQPDLLVLPTQSLYGTNRIYIVEDSRLRGLTIKRVGEVVINGEAKILIKSDKVKPGDQIVTTQLPNAITGLKVQVVGS